MISNEEFERMKRESEARRVAHPDWPSHRCITYFYGEAKHVIETMPVGRTDHVGRCKYCGQTHRNWWAMDARETDAVRDGPLLLCGECEYASLQRDT